MIAVALGSSVPRTIAGFKFDMFFSLPFIKIDARENVNTNTGIML
jgi:hypothetical protein